MKKIIPILSAFLSVFLLCSCAGNGNADSGTTSPEVTADVETEAETETETETVTGEDIFKDDDVTVVCTGVELKSDNLYLVRFASVKNGDRKLNCWVTGISVDGVEAHKDIKYLIAGLADRNDAEGTVIIKSGDFSEGEIDFGSVKEITFTLTVTDEDDSTYTVEKTITVKV